MVDAQFADSLPHRLHVTGMAKGEAVQTGRNQGTDLLALESKSPLPEYFCLLDVNHWFKL